MGKPYASELQKLPETYNWAMNADVRPLADLVGALAPHPLLAVGSGGSFTAAAVATYFHQRYAQKLAHAVTPMEAVSLPALAEVGVLLATGGGKNPDVLSAFKRLASKEPQQVAVICASENSPLAKLVQDFWYARFFEFSLPSGRDGFIATNTLVATSVLLARAYQDLYADNQLLPPDFSDLWRAPFAEISHAIEETAGALSRFDSLLILYGPTGFPAALDLESKCHETGLANIQITDYRNFAHGRHYGLDVRSNEVAVLALISDDDRDLARKTLSLLPQSISVASIDARGTGGVALIATLISAIYWVGFRAKGRGLDPGRPSVAQFGRKLYRLSSFRPLHALQPEPNDLAIERKARTSITRLAAAGSLDRWNTALDAVLSRYEGTCFRAVVFDYDGTLCPPRRRYKGIDQDMAHALGRLLDDGLLIGIATGRGKSVREDLATQIEPRHWERVWIGYYNGGQLAPLADTSMPNKAITVDLELDRFTSWIGSDERLNALIELDRSSSQITIFPKAFQDDEVWDALQQHCRAEDHVLVRSTHSFDVLAPGVSKLNLVRQIRTSLGDSIAPILRIGDLGRWPGNDHELLADAFGLSVDQVSINPAECWNFAPAGHRGAQATLDYLNALTTCEGSVRVGLERLGLKAMR